MNSITVCVDMSDLLAISLPYNRHHWDKVLVVTSLQDEATKQLIEDMQEPGVTWYATDAFYQDGADFNKWKALEEGLDVLGRDGWLCIWDCDVLWPKDIRFVPGGQDSLDMFGPGMRFPEQSMRLRLGSLCTPRRRMWSNWPERPDVLHGFCHPAVSKSFQVSDEDTWRWFPLHPQQREFAGYSQIFHASDPVLGPPPWHQTNWRHAGGADSAFQDKWPAKRKIRPPFECLHLGPAGVNWLGRASARLDGTVPEGAAERVARLREMIRKRGQGPDRFRLEKI